MRSTSRCRILAQQLVLCAAILSPTVWFLRAADPVKPLTSEQKEHFLRTARVMNVHGVTKGITGTVRVTLSDGTITHDASVQRINDSQLIFEGGDGSKELNFKDTYKYNIAAWKLAQVLGIDDMVPPSVERSYEGKAAAFTWWVEDVRMDEETRILRKMSVPDTDRWNEEMYVVRVFDQLIYNTDRNLTNLLIDDQWRIWMIDHTRAFRLQRTLRKSQNLVECDRQLLARMKALDEVTLERQLKPYVSREEIRGLLARRDLIVKFFEMKGTSALYDRPPRT
ncbi:MAG TPA: hypothetical protein VJ732_03500 [Bryobacteraceae bacterium]|nr:hypothetical protein [Bryobacteraceae bacterium]